jgi:lysozyme
MPYIEMKSDANAGLFKMAFERRSLKAYPDSGGIPTIGIGRTRYSDGRSVKLGDTITTLQMQQFFEDDQGVADAAVNRVLKRSNASVSQSRFGILSDITFNAGPDFIEGADFEKAIKSGDPNDDAILLAKWVSDNGKLVDGLMIRGLMRIRVYLWGYQQRDITWLKIRASRQILK